MGMMNIQWADMMYTVSPEVTESIGSNHLYLTTVLVLLGLLRYIQIAVVDEKSGDPVKVMLHDRFSQLIVLLWLASYLVLIYL
jgi:decaprenyl-phosphate phosphoribosyltransferase